VATAVFVAGYLVVWMLYRPRLVPGQNAAVERRDELEQGIRDEAAAASRSA